MNELREALVGLGALVRRDLSAGRRGTTLAGARLAVVLLSGTIALLSLRFADDLYGSVEEAGFVGWLLPWSLAIVSLLLLPVLALQALRSERGAGALDLLLLAGLTPRRLALGRWLSTFLLLESLLLDALPAMAVFVFFAAPDPADLAWGVLALTAWNLLIAGLAPFLAATIGRAGPRAAAAVSLQVALVAGTIYCLSTPARARIVLDGAPAPPFVLVSLTASVLPPSLNLNLTTTHGARLRGAAVAALTGALLAVAAGARLSRQARPAQPRRPRLRWGRFLQLGASEKIGEAPLPWLLQRGSPALRPLTLALLAPFAIPLLGLALAARGWLSGQPHGFSSAFDEVLLGSLAAGYWLLALFLAAFASALQVSRARERHEWDSVLSTAASGRRLIAGLLAGPAVAAAVPLGLSAGLLAMIGLMTPSRVEDGLQAWAGQLACLIGTVVLALAVGLVASLAARSQAGALGLCVLLLLTSVVAATLTAAWLEGSDLAMGFEATSRFWAVALALSVVVPLQVALLERRRFRPGAVSLYSDLSCGAILITPPIVEAASRTELGTDAAALVGLAAFALTLPLAAVVLRRPDWWLGRTG